MRTFWLHSNRYAIGIRIAFLVCFVFRASTFIGLMKVSTSAATSDLSWTKAGEAVAAELYDDVDLTTGTNTCFILPAASGNIIENACSDALPFICKSGQLSFWLFVYLSKAPFIPVILLASCDCFAIKCELHPIGKSIKK